MTDKVIQEIRLIETDAGFRLEINGDKDQLKEMGIEKALFGFGRMMRGGPGRRHGRHRDGGEGHERGKGHGRGQGGPRGRRGHRMRKMWHQGEGKQRMHGRGDGMNNSAEKTASF